MPLIVPITSETKSEPLIEYAISEITRLRSGEEFCIGDLFPKYEWFRLPNHVRANVGAGFYHQYATNENISQVDILEKSTQGQQLYKKK